MLQFEEPCNLIGRYRFKPLMRNQIRPEHADFTQMSPIRVSNFTKKIRMKLCSGFEKKHKKPPFLPFLALFSKFTFLAITPEEEFGSKCGFTRTSPLKAFYLTQKKTE